MPPDLGSLLRLPLAVAKPVSRLAVAPVAVVPSLAEAATALSRLVAVLERLADARPTLDRLADAAVHERERSRPETGGPSSP